MKKNNIMKKIGCFVLIGILTLTVVACSPNKPTTGESGKNPSVNENPLASEPLSSILDKIYEKAGLETPKLAHTEINAENIEYFLGTSNIEFTEGMASEPMMSSYAHSIVLIRAKDGSDVTKIMNDIKTNVDPRKWICVGVEPENVIVDNVGDLVILIMDERSEEFQNTFLELAK